MANWKDLTDETRHRILVWFCKSIIGDFTELGINVWDQKHFNGPFPRDWEIEGPPSPSCLKSFSSAIQSSRYFYITITRRIAIKRKTTSEILQLIQYRRVRQIEKGSQTKIRKHMMYYEKLQLLKRLTGCFWKNPFLLDDSRFLKTCSRVFQNVNSLFFFPI